MCGYRNCKNDENKCRFRETAKWLKEREMQANEKKIPSEFRHCIRISARRLEEN